MSAEGFAQILDRRFRDASRGLTREEHLFCCLHTILASGRLRGINVATHIVHGNSYQVQFDGREPYSPIAPRPRCEIADLLLVTYSARQRQVRASWLQAKVERYARNVQRHNFYLDTKQWYLLARRPEVVGLGNFRPPSDLLSGALLHSAGTFGFFYDDLNGEKQIYYSIANRMKINVRRSGYKGHGQPHNGLLVRTVHRDGIPYEECVAATNTIEFARALYNMQIGTPLSMASRGDQNVSSWLAANFRGLAQQTVGQQFAMMANEVSQILAPESDEVQNGSFGAKHVVMLLSVD